MPNNCALWTNGNIEYEKIKYDTCIYRVTKAKNNKAELVEFRYKSSGYGY